MKNNRWTKDDIAKLPKHAQDQIKDQLAEHTNTVEERYKQQALVVPAQAPSGMVDITGPVLVRITRVGRRRLDSDNFSGGAKQLRDAIASVLGRKGDSEADEMYWDYKQKKGPPETIIEIFQKGKNGKEKDNNRG